MTLSGIINFIIFLIFSIEIYNRIKEDRLNVKNIKIVSTYVILCGFACFIYTFIYSKLTHKTYIYSAELSAVLNYFYSLVYMVYFFDIVLLLICFIHAKRFFKMFHFLTISLLVTTLINLFGFFLSTLMFLLFHSN